MKTLTSYTPRRLKIAAAQINPIVGDIDGNIDRMLQARKDARDTELVVFSELCLCGYIPEDLLYRRKFLQACAEGIERLRTELRVDKGSSILFGAPRQGAEKSLEQNLERRFEDMACGKKLHNSAFLIDSSKDSELSYCDKSHLPNYGVFDEKRYFEPAETCNPLTLQGVKLGVMICEDFWYDDVVAGLRANVVDLLVVLNASPFERDKHKHRLARAQGIVAKTSIPLLYVNQIGGQDELVFDGGSFALSRTEAKEEVTEGLQIASPIELPFFEERTRNFLYLDKRLTLAEEFNEESCSSPASSSVSSDDQEGMTYRAIELAIRDYVRKNRISKVLLGISGGIDSALCASLACDALGSSMVEGLFMPSPYTSLASGEDARDLAQRLGFRLHELAINGAMDSISSIFSDGIGEDYNGVAAENVQARLRAVLLMAYANHRSSSAGSCLLLSTGNKSEYATSYTTLYGDMCGGFAPIKDLYKTDVYSLCLWRNLGMGFTSSDIVPLRILTKAPTAELRLNQRDDDTLPPYISLDLYLRHFIENESFPSSPLPSFPSSPTFNSPSSAPQSSSSSPSSNSSSSAPQSSPSSPSPSLPSTPTSNSSSSPSPSLPSTPTSNSSSSAPQSSPSSPSPLAHSFLGSAASLRSVASLRFDSVLASAPPPTEHSSLASAPPPTEHPSFTRGSTDLSPFSSAPPSSPDPSLNLSLPNYFLPPTQQKKINFSLQSSEHKRWQSPPGPKLKRCSFGRERRYPISNYFLERNYNDE